MQAAAKQRWSSDDLRGKRIAIQGCGNVGYGLARELHSAGAQLLVSDIDAEKVNRAVQELGAVALSNDAIYAADADILAPCALGGTINSGTIPQLKVEIVCGGANNQLLEPADGDALEARGILYAPDYVVNGGGVLSGGADLLNWPLEQVRERVLAIYDTLLSVFAIAKAESVPTYKAADLMAQRHLREGIERRATHQPANRN
jgi:leucine dehydrogenase